MAEHKTVQNKRERRMSWQYQPPVPDEVQEKINAVNAEKAQASFVNGCPPPLTYGGQLQGQAQAFGLRESLSHRIERQLENARSDRDRYARALDILKRHPEFEELIELLNMHLI
jgi:hypothetical protein